MPVAPLHKKPCELPEARVASHHLTGVVDAVGPAVGAAERAQIGDADARGPHKCVILATSGDAAADDLPSVVDGLPVAVITAQRADVDHPAQGPPERVGCARGRGTATCNLA